MYRTQPFFVFWLPGDSGGRRIDGYKLYDATGGRFGQSVAAYTLFTLAAACRFIRCPLPTGITLSGALLPSVPAVQNEPLREGGRTAVMGEQLSPNFL